MTIKNNNQSIVWFFSECNDEHQIESLSVKSKPCDKCDSLCVGLIWVLMLINVRRSILSYMHTYIQFVFVGICEGT